MQENLINTKMKEMYYYNPCLIERDDSVNNANKEILRFMDLCAMQNYNFVKIAS